MNNLLQLFISFLQIGLFSIGGGYVTIPLIKQQIVSVNNWISMKEFSDIITISQMTPGPLAVNTATFVGIRIAGVYGAIVATFGCILCGIMISIFIYKIFEKYKNSNIILDILNGLRSSSTGLIASVTCTLVSLALFKETKIPTNILQIDLLGSMLFLISIYVLYKWNINTILIIFITGIVGLFIY